MVSSVFYMAGMNIVCPKYRLRPPEDQVNDGKLGPESTGVRSLDLLVCVGPKRWSGTECPVCTLGRPAYTCRLWPYSPHSMEAGAELTRTLSAVGSSNDVFEDLYGVLARRR